MASARPQKHKENISGFYLLITHSLGDTEWVCEGAGNKTEKVARIQKGGVERKRGSFHARGYKAGHLEERR